MKLDLRSLRKHRCKDTGMKGDSPTLPNIPDMPFPSFDSAVIEFPKTAIETLRTTMDPSRTAMDHLRTTTDTPRNPTDPPRTAADPSRITMDSSRNTPTTLRSPTMDHASRTANKSSGFFTLDAALPAMSTVRLEDTVKRLFSAEHLHHILDDRLLFQRFSTFVNKYLPQHVSTLSRYMDLLKATKAIEYANAITRQISLPAPTGFPKPKELSAMMDPELQETINRDVKVLCNEVLSAFITQTLVSTVSDCIIRDISGTSLPAMTDLMGALADVFCLTDPALPDNPIIYSSAEFYQTTQYGTSFAIGRNCRFLQGPETDRNTVQRLSKAIKEGKECCETLLNYRRDGTPFVNLLMMAPLLDDIGHVKYFIGAQVDVSGLVEQGRGIKSYRSLLQRTGNLNPDPLRQHPPHRTGSPPPLKLVKQLCHMFNPDEAEVVKQLVRDSDTIADDERSTVSSIKARNDSASSQPARRVIGAEISDRDPMMKYMASELSTASLNSLDRSSSILTPGSPPTLPGPYKHYLLIRPHPSLQIVFTSPSLRIPGLLRSKFLHKINGPASTLAALESAFIDGASCTAKIIWLPKSADAKNHPRWIRCNPLLGADAKIGVWMIILVPVDAPPPPACSDDADVLTFDVGGALSSADHRRSTSTTQSTVDLAEGAPYLRGGAEAADRRDHAAAAAAVFSSSPSQYPLRTASIAHATKRRGEGPGMAVRLVDTPPLTPMDRELFAEPSLRWVGLHEGREAAARGEEGGKLECVEEVC